MYGYKLCFPDKCFFFFLQYGELMEQFKEFHKELERLKSSGFSTGEIKKVYTLYARNSKDCDGLDLQSAQFYATKRNFVR